MPVLIGCEESQIVCKAFRDAGYEAYSCDLQPTRGNPDWHFQQDIMSKSDEEYILMVLRQKSADDCVLREVRPGVWSCTEFKSGKIFMVRR